MLLNIRYQFFHNCLQFYGFLKSHVPTTTFKAPSIIKNSSVGALLKVRPASAFTIQSAPAIPNLGPKVMAIGRKCIPTIIKIPNNRTDDVAAGSTLNSIMKSTTSKIIARDKAIILIRVGFPNDKNFANIKDTIAHTVPIMNAPLKNTSTMIPAPINIKNKPPLRTNGYEFF